MNIIIAGGRDFDNYDELCKYCDHVLRYVSDITIISGCAKGADKLGERYAEDRNYPIIYHPADWDGKGNAAGYIRNEEMADNAHALIAFWDGKSNGTKHMIRTASKKNILIRVFHY